MAIDIETGTGALTDIEITELDIELGWSSPVVKRLIATIADRDRRLKRLLALDSAVTKRHAMWAKETDNTYAGYRSVALIEFREIRGEQERQLKAG